MNLGVQQQGMKHYAAPEGYVFDYKEPHYAVIKELDGSITTKQQHLYAKYLTLGHFDSLDNYTVVEDPWKGR